MATDALTLAQQIRDVASDLLKKRSVKMSMPASAVATLNHFEVARPFTTVTGVAREEAIGAIQHHVQGALRRGVDINMDGAVLAAGMALKATYVQRLGSDGGDTRFAPLNPRYAAMKARHGLGSKIGVATGNTLTALAGAKVTVVPQ